ncbi:MAG: histidine kinase [Ginsengibacter sp.]
MKSILSDKHLRIFFAAWWLLCMAIQFYVLKQLGIDDRYASIDSLVSIILLAGGSFFISNNLKYYLPRKEKYWYIIIISITVGFFWFLLQRGVLWMVLKTGDPYNEFISDTATIRFGAGFLLLSTMSMFSLMWYGQQEYTEMINRKAETEQLSKEAELFKLRSQFQPHFLFNSLNSISALIGSDPEKARHMIYQLSDFLRGTLKKDEHQWIALEEEIQYLQLYLEIEKVRFGHRLKTEINVPQDALALHLPALILQPVVENAIKYGLYDTTGEVLIRIEVESKHGNLHIEVRNPFDPETTHPTKGTGFGLRSIQRRLFLLFARNDLLRTSIESNLYITTIVVPQTLQPQQQFVNETERK